MMQRYVGEFGLSSVMDFFMMMRPRDLRHAAETHNEQASQCHIYMIARRPKITIDTSRCSFAEGNMNLMFLIQRGDTLDEYMYYAEGSNIKAGMIATSTWPHKLFNIEVDGEVVFADDCCRFLCEYATERLEFLDLEVMYVGQSYGNSGSRSALDRLNSHSTLQQIFADLNEETPDQDVWLLLMRFNCNLLISMNGIIPAKSTDEEEHQRISNVLSNRVSEEHLINYTEAALIRHFQPKYNEMYKNNFPDPSHKSYAECYDLDLSMLLVEIEIPGFFVLWSSSRERELRVMAEFHLQNAEDRRRMFDITAISNSTKG